MMLPFPFGIPDPPFVGYANQAPWSHGCSDCEAGMARSNVTTPVPQCVGADITSQNQVADQAQQRAVVIGVLALLAVAAVIYQQR